MLRDRATGEYWSPLVGVRRAAVTLAIRAIILTALWAGLIWLLTPLLNQIPAASWTRRGGIALAGVLALLSAIPGSIIGYAMTRDLTEKAGMAGGLVTILALLFGFATVFGGMWIAEALRALHAPADLIIPLAAGFFAGAWILKATLLDT